MNARRRSWKSRARSVSSKSTGSPLDRSAGARTGHAAEGERGRLAVGLDEPALAGAIARQQAHDGLGHRLGRDDVEALRDEFIAQRLDERRLGEPGAYRV